MPSQAEIGIAPCPSDNRFFIGLVVVFGLFFLFIGYVFAASLRKSDAEVETYRGATLVKICRDGTRVLHLKDGRYVAYGYEVENPQTVCEGTR